jgi:hypothetical protein
LPEIRVFLPYVVKNKQSEVQNKEIISISFESRKPANEKCAGLYETDNADGVKKSSLSEWHNIFKECREKVMDIERSSRL